MVEQVRLYLADGLQETVSIYRAGLQHHTFSPFIPSIDQDKFLLWRVHGQPATTRFVVHSRVQGPFKLVDDLLRGLFGTPDGCFFGFSSWCIIKGSNDARYF